MKYLHTNKDVKDYTNYTMIRIPVKVAEDLIISGQFARCIRDLRKTTNGTWGYGDFQTIYGGYGTYIFFQDEIDCLAFSLKCPFPLEKVIMWPAGLRFTVYEFVDEH